MEKVCEIIEKYWLKPISSIFLAIVMGAVYAWAVSTLNEWEVVALDKKKLLCLAITVAVVKACWLDGFVYSASYNIYSIFSSLCRINPILTPAIKPVLSWLRHREQTGSRIRSI